MNWPDKLLPIIIKYHQIQTNNNNFLSLDQRIKFVDELIDIYIKLDSDKRTDVLIPAKGEWLQEFAISRARTDVMYIYELRYDWPLGNDGFYGKFKSITLYKGFICDRIGNDKGSYFCNYIDKKPQSIAVRSLPYYFTDKEKADITACPSYHAYIISKNIKTNYGNIKNYFENKDNQINATQLKSKKAIYELIESHKIIPVIFNIDLTSIGGYGYDKKND